MLQVQLLLLEPRSAGHRYAEAAMTRCLRIQTRGAGLACQIARRCAQVFDCYRRPFQVLVVALDQNLRLLG